MNPIYVTILFSVFIWSGCDSPKKNSTNNYTPAPENEIVEDEPNRNEYISLAEEVIELSQDVSSEIQENRSEKDSTYQANRSEKWAIKIGDMSQDEAYLFEDYKAIEGIGGVSFFKTNEKNLFMFLDQSGTEFELIQKLPFYQEKIASTGLSIEVIDLNAFCSRKQMLVITSPIQLGKGKNRIEVKCYTCSK